MSKRIKHPAELVVKARDDYFIKEKSLREIAITYGVPKRTVHMWVTREKRINDGGADGEMRNRGWDKRNRLT